MRMWTKRFSTLLLCVALGLTTAGCSGDKSASNNTGMKENEDGLTIITGNRVLPEDNPTKAWMEEELGFPLKFITVPSNDEYITKVNLLIASDEMPDIITDSSVLEYYKHVSQGLFIELTDLLEKYGQNILAARPAENFENLKWTDGKLYVISSSVNPGYDGMMVRKDWLDKVNLPVPETLEDFKNVAKVFAENDMNGNGKADELGYGGWNPSDPIIPFNAFFCAYGANPYGWILKDGKVVHGGLQTETKEAVKFLSQMYAEGLIDPEYLTTDRTKLNEKVGTERVGLLTDQLWYANRDNSTFYPHEDVEWQLIPPPKGPDGKQGLIVRTDPDAVGRTGITKACKNPVNAMKYLNFVADKENFTRIRTGIEGVHYELIDGVSYNIGKYKEDTSHLIQEGIAPTMALPFSPEDPPAVQVPQYMADFRDLVYSYHIRSNVIYGGVPEIEDKQIGTGWKDFYSQSINQMIMEGGDIDAKFDQMVADIYGKYHMAEQEKVAEKFYSEMKK